MIGITDFVKDLTGTTAQEATKVDQALRSSAKKKRYYLEFRGKAPDGSADTLATGTVKIEGKIAHDGGWQEITAAQDITGVTHVYTDFAGAYVALRFTGASLEADHTLDIFIRVVDDV